jgi:hypothetical protein
MDGRFSFARALELQLQDFLTKSGVEWYVLDEPGRIDAWERWRSLYGLAFRGRPRLRHGVKAEHEFGQIACDDYVILPICAKIDGLPMGQPGHPIHAYQCRGPLVPLGAFCVLEFCVSPPDLGWTMVHTHEDHGYGGPYFLRREWIP